MSVLTVAPVLPDVAEPETLNDDAILSIVKSEKVEVLKDARGRADLTNVRAWSFGGRVD